MNPAPDERLSVGLRGYLHLTSRDRRQVHRLSYYDFRTEERHAETAADCYEAVVTPALYW